MATGYTLSKIAVCGLSSKTAIEKYKELPSFAKTFLANRPQRVAMYEQLGYVYCDQLGDWYILVDGQIYLGKQLSQTEFNDPYRYLGDKNLQNDQRALENSGAVSPGPYQIRYDSVLNAYYFFNELGQRVYISSQTALSWGANPIQDITVIPRVKENPAEFDSPTVQELKDPFEVVLDILKNPIVAKQPVAGLYETQSYLDSVRKKRDQYRKINQGLEVSSLYKIRLNDIIAQQNQLLRSLNEIEKTTSSIGAITPMFSVAINFLAPGAGKLAGSTVQAVAQLAETRKDNLKIKNLTEDFLYLEKEREAIEQTFRSSDAGSPQDHTLTYVLIGLGLVAVSYFLIRKKWLQ